MSVISALKNQLKSEMYAETQLIAERSDELLYQTNILKSESAQKQPGIFTYLIWRLKVIHC
jgi:hypothetical protein